MPSNKILMPKPSLDAQVIYSDIESLSINATFDEINTVINKCINLRQERIICHSSTAELLQTALIIDALVAVREALRPAKESIFVTANISTEEERAAFTAVKNISALFTQGASDTPPSFDETIKTIDASINSMSKNKSYPILDSIKRGLGFISQALAGITVLSVMGPLLFGYIGDKLTISGERPEKYSKLSQKMVEIKKQVELMKPQNQDKKTTDTINPTVGDMHK